MKRNYSLLIEHHLQNYEEMLFLAGPRQTGKTTLAQDAQALFNKSCYLNWDNLDDQHIILKGPSAIISHCGLDQAQNEKSLIIFDELHKYKHWRNFIKGFFDSYKKITKIIVTGSAKLDVFNCKGDSLLGRYFLYHIFPFSVGELCNAKLNTQQIIQPPNTIKEDLFKNIIQYGGFPKPLITAEKQYLQRWNRTWLSRLIREDLTDLTKITDLKSIEMLTKILTINIGQTINYTSVSKTIRVSDQTIREWIGVLESLHFGFTIRPWHKNLLSSIKKQPKFYLWNWSLISDTGKRNENIIACHLYKAIQYWNDSGFGEFDLFFIRTKDQREVDFLITKDEAPWILIEVKTSAKENLSPQLYYFQDQLKTEHAFQVSMNMPFVNKNCFDYKSPIKIPASTFLSQLF